MMKKILAGVLLLAAACQANAQFVPGQAVTASALNAALATPIITGGSITGVPITNPRVSGGSIDNTPVGFTIPTTGAFTTLSSTGLATLNGLSVSSAPTFSSPLGIASGGTNASIASGTSLDNITGFSSTGFLTRTGAGAYAFQSTTNGITLGNIAQIGANTVLANATNATANVAAFSMPSCSGANNALRWASGTGFTCASSIALTSSGLNQFASTTSAQLSSIISDETGSGSLVFATNPALAGFTSSATVTINAAGGGVIVNDTAGASHANYYLQNTAVNKWGIRSASTISDQFQINRYVSGVFTDTPISIANATGIVTMPDGLTVSGQTSLAGSVGAEALRAVTTASAVNWLQVAGATTGNAPSASSQGSDTNIGLTLSSKGTSSINLNTGGGTQVQILNASTVNRAVLLSGSNGGNPTIGTTAGNLQFTSNVVIAGGSVDGTPVGATTPSTGAFTTLSSSGLFTPTGGIAGVTNGSAAAAGSVGQVLSNATTATSLTTNTAANLTSVSLTAGDWDVQCTGTFVPAGTTTVQGLIVGVSTTSATQPAGNTGALSNFQASFVTGVNDAIPTPTTQINVASTTTAYCVGTAAFGVSTMTANGFIRARRMR